MHCLTNHGAEIGQFGRFDTFMAAELTAAELTAGERTAGGLMAGGPDLQTRDESNQKFAVTSAWWPGSSAISPRAEHSI